MPGSPARAWQFHSFIGVNPLQTTWPKRGIVSGRVALLPRSAEIQPPFHRFSDWTPNRPITLHTLPTHLRGAARGCLAGWLAGSAERHIQPRSSRPTAALPSQALPPDVRRHPAYNRSACRASAGRRTSRAPPSGARCAPPRRC